MPSKHISRRTFLNSAGATGAALILPAPGQAERAAATMDRLRAGWLHPTRSYRPHTRWWWPGSAVTREGLTWQLERMRGQGMGGVELMWCWKMYAKGDIPFLSRQWLGMVRHAIAEARRLDMEVALTMGAGWSFGGSWVPLTDRSKVLAPAWLDLKGPGEFDDELPAFRLAPRAEGPEGALHLPDWKTPEANQAIAVVAGRWDGSRIDGESLVDLTPLAEGNRLCWRIPDGSWRLMAFRLVYTGQQNQGQNYDPPSWVIDHFSKGAVERYLNHLGGAFYRGFGEEFGRTVDSFFCDSFEIHPLPNTLGWSNDTLENFRPYKGYDLARYLPAIWWDIGELTPRVRYDINEYLHQAGLEVTFRTFIDWSARHNVQARVQPHYRFTEELIEGAGMVPRPETEVCTARFEVVTDPRKATAAGAHFYGREILSAEAYTFLHPERYRSTLEEMKRATDAFLRDGVTQLYNHGYFYSPEMHVSPAREVPWANRISHVNTWWRYYHHLTAYISRCCFLLRQGSFVGDVLAYSPQATVWTQRAVFGSDRRVMPYGTLGKTLVANGYDFDPVNDDVLQNRARVESGHVQVRDLRYRFLILPNVRALPVETLEFIRSFVLGGGIVIALGELPAHAVGMRDWRANDERVGRLVGELFGPDGKGKSHAGGGRTYHIPEYKIEDLPFTPMEQPYQPTPPMDAGQAKLIEVLRLHLAPDFSLEGQRQSDGLTHLHRRVDDMDVYFVTNLQPKPSRFPVTFRVKGKYPECWNARTGEVWACPVYRVRETGVEIPLEFEPWESVIVLFRPGEERPHVTKTTLPEVREISGRHIIGAVRANGQYAVEVAAAGRTLSLPASVSDVPPELPVGGPCKLVLEGHDFPRLEKSVDTLASWTEEESTKHFSGTGEYDVSFDLAAEYFREGLDLMLDLGNVGDVAEVELNGKPVGVTWMQPHRLTATHAARPGRNTLKVLVTNTPQNWVAGLKQPPGVPEELVPHYGPTVDIYKPGTSAWEAVDRRFSPLPPSGLMGPVRMVALRKVVLEFQGA
jgi:hypothetical protein